MANNDQVFDDCENLFRYDVTIPSGASVSDIIQTQGRVLVALLIPAAWTAASLSYNVSLDGVTMKGPAQDSGGNVYRTTVTVNKPTCFPTADAIKWPFLQLVSVDGAGAAVVQGADRVITLILSRFLGGQ